jgi:hypothetical protein
MNTGSHAQMFNRINQNGFEDNHSNTNMNEQSKQSMTNPTSYYNQNSVDINDNTSSAITAQWATQKEFLKMSNTCQNKQ